jgi:hypothetical protein
MSRTVLSQRTKKSRLGELDGTSLSQPQLGVSADLHLRKFVLTRFPFTLYYSVAVDVLRIQALAHKSRPGYWKERVDE